MMVRDAPKRGCLAGKAELLNLEFLGSVPFDTNYVKIQWSFMSVLYSAVDCVLTLSQTYVLWV